ncbi:MAG: hypothetical protein A3F68_09630 [Acidobacteria bacterium RIFCSPLOWO2_12_FULL_54_10]|nr:MAG: hypothetical protein A3F68_09630 [Acidobacteria bacterium RIFCSPLOWO2_12_FULL_54_10]
MSTFMPSPTEGAFQQGEILTDVIQVHIRVETLAAGADDIELQEKNHPYAVVITQACDLDWDFKVQNGEQDQNLRELKLVPNILLCEVIDENTLRPKIRGSDIWKRIVGNQDERYHSFPPIKATADLLGQGLPALIVDFKRVFTIPSTELYRRLVLGLRRRAVLTNPFLQHFSSRFGYYCLRVALPESAVEVLPAQQPNHQLNAAVPPPVHE